MTELVAGLDKPGRSTAGDLANAEDSSLVALRSVTGFALIAATVLASGVASVDANVVKVAVSSGVTATTRPSDDVVHDLVGV